MSWTQFLGFVVCVPGALITGLNFYLSFICYPLHVWRGGSKDYRVPSGIPLFGSMFLWIGAWLFVDQPILMWGAIIVSLLDTAGLHMFAIMMIYALLFYRDIEKPS